MKDRALEEMDCESLATAILPKTWEPYLGKGNLFATFTSAFRSAAGRSVDFSKLSPSLRARIPCPSCGQPFIEPHDYLVSSGIEVIGCPMVRDEWLIPLRNWSWSEEPYLRRDDAAR